MVTDGLKLKSCSLCEKARLTVVLPQFNAVSMKSSQIRTLIQAQIPVAK